MIKKRTHKRNLCLTCKVQEVTPCPLLERIIDQYEGMGECEFYRVAEKLYYARPRGKEHNNDA